MGFFILYLIIIFLLIITFVFATHTFEKYFYYLVDTVIISAFFIIGIMDSWGLHSWIKIISWCPYYILFRSIITAIAFGVKKYNKKSIKAFSCGKLHTCLIILNILINVIFIHPFMIQWIGASGV